MNAALKNLLKNMGIPTSNKLDHLLSFNEALVQFSLHDHPILECIFTKEINKAFLF